MLWDVDLNHQSCRCLHDHVEGLRVSDLGQWENVSHKWWHVGCVLPKGGWSMTWLAPRPPSSVPFQAAAWGRSTPQGHVLPAPPHRHLQWWGAATDRHSWSHEWIRGPHPCPASAICHQCFTINFLSDMMVDLKASFRSSAKRSLNVLIMASSRSLVLTELPLGSEAQSRGSHHQGLW